MEVEKMLQKLELVTLDGKKVTVEYNYKIESDGKVEYKRDGKVVFTEYDKSENNKNYVVHDSCPECDKERLERRRQEHQQ